MGQLLYITKLFTFNAHPLIHYVQNVPSALISPVRWSLEHQEEALWSELVFFIYHWEREVCDYSYINTLDRTPKLSRGDRAIKSVETSPPTTTRVPLTLGNQSEAVPPGHRWNSCFTCDEHTGAEPARLVMKQRPSWLHYVSLKTKFPQRRCSFKLMCYREPRSSVHPSERLLADGWHSEQRAPNPL